MSSLVKSQFFGRFGGFGDIVTEEKVGKLSKRGGVCYVDRTGISQMDRLWKWPVEKPVEIVEKFDFPQPTPAELPKRTLSR